MDEPASTYAYYPVFRRTSETGTFGPDGLAAAAREWDEILHKREDRITVRGAYSAAGLRPDADLMLWLVGSSPDDLQDAVVELRRTGLGWTLDLTHTFFGVHRPAEFARDHVPSFMRGEAPRRYLSVYPFVRTEEWYLLPPDQRAQLLRDHGAMGREYPDVLPNTTSAFGLGDWEWILAFESDRLERIVDCIRALRAAEARRYTKLDVPFVVGIRKDLPDAIADLG